ncbi:peptidoglycan-binding protein LysM [Desulfovibrio sp. OttesenSCG-928-C14]|nr:peptidoglycan-binding protein LysM [Desulfovibrio sp. OttesenSCG-928-C14]
MSIFSFLASVGKKLTGDDKGPKSEDLKKELDSYGLGSENVEVSAEGGKVTLKGKVKNQEALEKITLAVGNAHGVAEVDTDGVELEAGAQKEGVFYTVKSGDNLWKIAEAHYGKGQGAKNTLIFEANKPMLTSPDKIYPGQVLRIPPLN